MSSEPAPMQPPEESAPAQTPAPTRPWYLKWPVIAAAIILIPFILIRLTQWQAAAPPPGQPSGSVLQTGDPQADRELRAAQAEAERQQRIADAKKQEDRARVRAKLLAVSAKADEATRAVADLTGELDAWQAEVDPLLENDTGRRIAANAEATGTFATVQRAPRPLKADADSYQSQIAALVQPVKTALDQQNFDYLPGDGLAKDLDAIKSEAAAKAAKLRDARKQVQALARDAQASPPASVPLRQAMIDLDTRHAQERNQAIQQAEETARKAADAKLAELRAQAANDEAASQERKLKTEMRRKKAEDPTIQDRYKPFLAKGRFVFNQDGSGNGRTYSDIPAPASLRELREHGVLKNEFTFWATGAALGGNSPAYKHGYFKQGDGNDRPAWTGYPNTEEDHKLVLERYREFLDLAPIWVEMGVLRP
jgi:hypothetical protein